MRGFYQEGVGLTDNGEIEEGFWKFYSQVVPKLAARITREREGWVRGWRDPFSGG